MWLAVQPLMQQVAVSLLLSFLGKIVHLFLLWLLKKMLKGLTWVAQHTDMKTDDELVALLEKALQLQEQEPVSGPQHEA